MKCEQAGSLLVDYQRNELVADERLALALHLQECEHCSSELTALLEISQLLDREEQPSEAARECFLAQLPQQTSGARSGHPQRPALMPWLQQLWSGRPLAAFSYSSVLLVAGLFSGQLLPPHSLGVGPQEKLSADRIVQLCAVPPAPKPTSCNFFC